MLKGKNVGGGERLKKVQEMDLRLLFIFCFIFNLIVILV